MEQDSYSGLVQCIPPLLARAANGKWSSL